MVNKTTKAKQVKVLIVVVLLSLIGASIYFYSNYREDSIRREHNLSYVGRGGASNIGAAEIMMHFIPNFLEIISKCSFYPKNVEEFYKFDSTGKAEDCTPATYYKTQKPWIDPWGRPYQIRYDRERYKFQMRSLGRYWWWPWDNIEGEENLTIYADILNPEIEKDKIGKDSIFSRGWH